MVFFTCNACCESLKKSQVEKHYHFQCRKCEYLSCVDCGKEFWGETYKEHIKCITEEAKYSGKNYKPKANANKGEQKQEAWIQQVQAAISNAPKSNAQLHKLLHTLQDHPNIPRKQAKFENFVKNSLHVRNPGLVTETWNLLSAQAVENKQEQAPPSQPAPSAGQQKKPEKSESLETSAAEQKPNKSKKRRHQDLEEELKPVPELNGTKATKKKKKKKGQQEAPDEPEASTSKGKVSKKEQRRKRRQQEDNEEDEETSVKRKKMDGDSQEDGEAGDDEEEEEDADADARSRFVWEDVITEALEQAPEHQLSVKRLRKKVLAEFGAQGGDGKVYTDEKLMAKFKKKVFKNPRLKVLKDKVQLKLLN